MFVKPVQTKIFHLYFLKISITAKVRYKLEDSPAFQLKYHTEYKTKK